MVAACVASSSRLSVSISTAIRCASSRTSRPLFRSRLQARFSSSTTAPASDDLVSELESRGLVQTVTSRALSSHLSSAPRVVYSGVDPSADSLHVGNLLPLLTLVHFARFNHTPIVLVGGATGSIGDPSGRSSERNALDKNTLQANVRGIKGQLRAFFENVAEYYREHDQTTTQLQAPIQAWENEGISELGMNVKMMNNYDWMSGISLLDFLSNVGRHARLTHMLARDSVASRLAPSSSSSNSGMSYTEFSYQLLQAFDFSHLHSHHHCTVQIGGSDQLGNIVAGIDLIRRTSPSGLTADDPAFGLTLPLLTTHSGEKFGKSAGNAVWLSGRKTSDLDFYQFFLRASDEDVGKYLRCLTLLSPHEVEKVMQEHDGDRKGRRGQKVLADHMTRLIRGQAAAEKCRLLTRLLFSHSPQDGTKPDDLEATARSALSALDVQHITEEDNLLTRLDKHLVLGVDLTKLVVTAGLVKSRAEAKRLLTNGGLYLNNRQLTASAARVGEDDLVALQGAPGRVCLLRAGKSVVRVVLVT